METRFFKTATEFRAWLVENHATATEIGRLTWAFGRRAA